MPKTGNYDAIIIGAGLSGLCAGIRLAMYDKRVCIFESHSTAGGLNSYYHRGTRNFDVGLHAMTNYVPKGVRNSPLAQLLKQLRIRYEELSLQEQRESAIVFPSCTLRFSNDHNLFVQEVTEKFPSEADNFRRLLKHIEEYDEISYDQPKLSARATLREFIRDPLLLDMLMCPNMFYGCPGDGDMDWTLFVVIWKSIFSTGLARPGIGMEAWIKILLDKFVGLGGEIKFSHKVDSISVQNGKAKFLKLENGDEISAPIIFSSAGYVETERLCDNRNSDVCGEEIGSISLAELIVCLDTMPQALGCDNSIIFFSNSDQFRFGRPQEAVEFGNGVLCLENNFGDGSQLHEGRVRLSHIASFPEWRKIADADTSVLAEKEKREKYREEKRKLAEHMIAETERWLPGLAKHVIFTDVFTPLTFKRYTGHAEGALYGGQIKRRYGRTNCENVFIIGADQGFFGIVGAMLSGISIANLYGLMGSR